MQRETPIPCNKSILATIMMLVALLISGCDRASTRSSAASEVTQTSPRDKSKQEKPLLGPAVSFWVYFVYNRVTSDWLTS
jgi:hypothetical protein